MNALTRLRVLNFKKPFHCELPQAFASHVLSFETCLRRVWMVDAAAADFAFLDSIPDCEQTTGKDAYEFLLKLAVGLESEIVGETDIFGQMKAAWANRFDGVPLSALFEQYLNPIFQNLFQDAKEFRTLYIQNMGSASYGSLIRRIFKKNHFNKGTLLLVGAGKLAQSIAPWLKDLAYDVSIQNRTREKAVGLAREEFAQMNCEVFDSFDEANWKKADQIIFCVPVDSAAESRIIETLRAHPVKNRIILHLGGIAKESAHWQGVEGFHSLDELFQLQKTADETRAEKLKQARTACEQRAILRSIGSSLSIAHGWEDLALFA